MLITNLQNMIDSRTIIADYITEYVNSTTYVKRFMEVNSFMMIENKAQSTYKNIIHLYNMGMITINNMWDHVNNTYLNLTMEKAITFAIVDFYGYNNGIEYLFQHIYIDGVNIPHIDNNNKLRAYLAADYSNIIIDAGIDDYIYNEVRLIDAIALMVNTIYPEFNINDFLEYLKNTKIFDTVIETRIDMTSNILTAQNEVIEKYLKYDNFLDLYHTIDPIDNLQTNITEISSIIKTITDGDGINLDMDIKKGFQFLFDGSNLKSFNSYDTSFDMLNDIKNIDLDFDIRYNFVEDTELGTTTIEFNKVTPHIIHTDLSTDSNDDDLNNPTYIEKLFSIIPTLSNLDQGLILAKKNIKSKFSGSIVNAFINIAGIKNTHALNLIRHETLQFVGPNLIDSLSTNLVITEEAITEYLLNMKQDSLYGSINEFMLSLQNKLQGISTINETWNVDLLSTFMDGVEVLIKSTKDAYRINDKIMNTIQLKIIEEFNKIINSETIDLINKIDQDLKVVLYGYMCKDIISTFSDKISDFTFDYLNDIKSMFELNYILEDKFTNRIIMENDLKNVIDKIIIPTYINFLFTTPLAPLNNTGLVRYGTFTALDKKYITYDSLINSILNNDISTITDSMYLSVDAKELLNSNLQHVNYSKLNTQLQYIDSSSPEVIINYNDQEYWVKSESEYTKNVRKVLAGLNINEVNHSIKSDVNLTIANRLKICSSDIFKKSEDKFHPGTTALVSMFVEYSVKAHKYAFNPEAKKYYTNGYLQQVDAVFDAELENGLGITETFGNSYNIYVLDTNLNSVKFTRSCDFNIYTINSTVVNMKNKDYAVLLSDSVELYNGKKYLFNSYKCTRVKNDIMNNLILTQFKINRSLLDDIELDVIDRDHRDLSLNVEAYEKYLVLKYLINIDIVNALNTTNMLSSLYTKELTSALKGSAQYRMFHDMYGIHRS